MDAHIGAGRSAVCVNLNSFIFQRVQAGSRKIKTKVLNHLFWHLPFVEPETGYLIPVQGIGVSAENVFACHFKILPSADQDLILERTVMIKYKDSL